MSNDGPTSGDDDAELSELVRRLELTPHPEGGWFRRIWTAPQVDPIDGRAAGSSILYLLPAHTSSRWHRIDASESWHHAAGAPMELSCWSGAGPVESIVLGPDVLGAHVPQFVVAPTVWQSASALGAWSLVSCVVVPEFRFDSFELAPEGWAPPRPTDR